MTGLPRPSAPGPAFAEDDSGVRRADFVEVDLRSIAADAVAFYTLLADLSGIALCLSVRGRATVDGDPLLLAQALGQLIDNALEYGRAAGNVEVVIDATQDACVVTVADDGPGIGIGDGNARGRGERFHRGDASRYAAHGRLGLHLVETVARLHGGTLALADDQPGSRTILTLPASGPVAASSAWRRAGLRRTLERGRYRRNVY